MKKLLSLGLTGLMLITLTACASPNKDSSTNKKTDTSSEHSESENDSDDYPYTPSDESSEQEINSDSRVGESVEFENGLIVTIDSVEDSSEEPNGDISGHLVKVVATFDNQTGNPLKVNGHRVSLYDSERNKAELDSKDYYSETIATGMKGTGAFYFDSIEHAPYSVIIGDATWITD